MLGLRAGAAVLRLARRTFAGQTACVYSRSSYRADRYVLWVPLRAPRRPLTPRRGTGDGHGDVKVDGDGRTAGDGAARDAAHGTATGRPA
jgi:GntR family transcriptional regulator